MSAWHVPGDVAWTASANHHLLDILGVAAIRSYCYTFQSLTIREGVASDTCHAVGNRHARKTTATLKRPIPDVRNAVWYRHARKTAAARERVPPDARHAIGYRHARQTITIPKRTITDIRHTIWYRYAY